MDWTNLAARAGRWSADNWKKAFFGWLAIALAASLLGAAAGHRKLADSGTASGEAARAQRMLEGAGFEAPATESVLVQAKDGTSFSPHLRAAVRDVVNTLLWFDDVETVHNPLKEKLDRGLVCADCQAMLVQFDVRGDAADAGDKIGPILAAVHRVQKMRPGFRIEEFGPASASHVLKQTLGRDFKRAERLTLPLTLLILLLAFGALVAAGLPLLLGFTAVLASTGVYSLLTYVTPGDFDTTRSVILLIGMAVGVDYSLFYLRREREERRAGLSPREALLRTAATSGQAVLVSGATVLVAMAGMFLAGNRIFTSMAVGTILVVLASAVGSVTVLAALLAKLGDRVDRGRLPFARRRRQPGEARVWGFVLGVVLRRPALSAGLAAGALIAATVPVVGMHTKLPSFTDLPRDLSIVSSYKRIQQVFPGSQTPAIVVFKGEDTSSYQFMSAYSELEQRALDTGLLFPPFDLAISPDLSVATLSVSLAGNGDDRKSQRALTVLRRDVIPAATRPLANVSVAVTGETAGTRDFNAQMKARMPYVFAFVLALAFALLLLTFRSIVVPLKTILLNLLSVGASYGVLVEVFQHRWAEGVLGFTSNGAVVSWLPLFLFVVLFGLSMDYHVFILSRVKELVDGGMPTDEAVAAGVRRTAGTVTSAALVMVGVFAIFASLGSLELKQMGVGLAVAVLIDATLVRGVLLPATMKLLGEWNWYLPPWLERLPRLTGERQPEPAEQPPADAPAVATT